MPRCMQFGAKLARSKQKRLLCSKPLPPATTYGNQHLYMVCACHDGPMIAGKALGRSRSMHTSALSTPHDDPCAICREPVVVGAGGTDPAACALDSCHHRFHCGCILQWAKIANTCPLCKRRFSRVDRLCLRATQPAAKRTPSVCVQLLAPTCCALSTSPGAGEFVAESIHVADRAQRESTVGGLDVESICCGICRSGDDEGELLLCDGGCGGAAHTFCIGLPTVPEGRWYCASCDPDINAARARLRTCDHGNTASRQRQRKRARPDDSYPSEAELAWRTVAKCLSTAATCCSSQLTQLEKLVVRMDRACKIALLDAGVLQCVDELLRNGHFRRGVENDTLAFTRLLRTLRCLPVASRHLTSCKRLARFVLRTSRCGGASSAEVRVCATDIAVSWTRVLSEAAR